jgi:hypothetical protein
VGDGRPAKNGPCALVQPVAAERNARRRHVLGGHEDRTGAKRILRAVADEVVGIDENTAIIVRQQRALTVLGEGAAYVIDAATTTYSNIGEVEADRSGRRARHRPERISAVRARLARH